MRRNWQTRRVAPAALLLALVVVAPVVQTQGQVGIDVAGDKAMLVPATLQVQQLGGDFKSYGTQQVITSPQKLTFRWIPKLQGIARARWQVAASSFSGSEPPVILLEGSVGPVPEVGHQGLFDIDFGDIVSPSPPAQPRKYFVRITTFAAARTAAGNTATPPATVVYTKPGPATTFTTAGLGWTTKQQFPALYSESPMPIVLDLKQLYVGNDNESSGDEPYLFVAVIYADGTTINPLTLSSSTVRVDSPSKTHGNVPSVTAGGEDLEDTSVVSIPAATGHFEKTITPIGLDLAANMEDADGKIGQAIANGTAVYVLVAAMEEDATQDDAANAARAAGLAQLKEIANTAVQEMTLADLKQGKSPTFDVQAIQAKLKEKGLDAAKEQTLVAGWWAPAVAPLYLDDIADPDDYVGWGVKKFTFGELLAAGANGIHFELELSNNQDWQGSYTVKGVIRRK